MRRKDECPCGSGRAYAACCEPYHRGVREPPDAEALMRSRFSAFVKKEPEHLWRTMHPDHEGRRREKSAFLGELKATLGKLRYAGLAVLDRRAPDAEGIAQVLFLARVFHDARELSFVELSDFAHDGEGWRYLRGETLPIGAIEGDPRALTIPAFDAAATTSRAAARSRAR